MMKPFVCVVCCLLIVAASVMPISAQTEFKKAMQKKHDLKSVSCNTCHTRKSDVPEDQLAAFKENAKSFRNDLGKEFDKLLQGKNVTERLKKAKDLPDEDLNKQKVKDEVVKEFLEALEHVEKMKSPSGETYGELIEQGKLDGVKLRK